MPLAIGPEHIQALTEAKRLMRPIRRTIGVARFDGRTLAFFAVLTVLFGYSSASGMVLGAGLGVIAWLELRHARRLERLEVGAAKSLAVNQLALGGTLIVYALWSLLFPPAMSSELAAPAFAAYSSTVEGPRVSGRPLSAL